MKKTIASILLLTLMLCTVAFPTVAEESAEISLDESYDVNWQDKINEETWEMLDAMSDDELLTVWCFRKDIEVPVEEKFKEQTGFDYEAIHEDGSEEKERFLTSFLSAKEEELGLEPGSLDRESLEGQEAISEAWDFASSVRRSIVKEAYTNSNQEFLDANIDPVRRILYFSSYSTTLIVEASKTEIISMAKDDSSIDIHYYGQLPEEDGYSEDDTCSKDSIINSPEADGDSTEESTEGITETGDVNTDGTVNSLDGAQVLKHDAELIALDREGLAVADVNGDGTVNSLDAAQILKYDAKLITEF